MLLLQCGCFVLDESGLLVASQNISLVILLKLSASFGSFLVLSFLYHDLCSVSLLFCDGTFGTWLTLILFLSSFSPACVY